jgi:hypothetical protein
MILTKVDRCLTYLGGSSNTSLPIYPWLGLLYTPLYTFILELTVANLGDW